MIPPAVFDVVNTYRPGGEEYAEITVTAPGRKVPFRLRLRPSVKGPDFFDLHEPSLPTWDIGVSRVEIDFVFSLAQDD